MSLYFHAAIFLVAGGLMPALPAAALSSWLPTSTIFLMVAVILLLRRPWVEHLLFGTAIYFTVFWIMTVVSVAIQGWPYSDAAASVVSLIPGVLLSGLWIIMWVLVRRYFRRLLIPNT